jgi:hypothetical protein
MIIHNLKIDDNHLENLISKIKKFEIRFNDRSYQAGDILRFEKYGTCYSFNVTHIHSGLGLEEGFIVMSVEPIERLKGNE